MDELSESDKLVVSRARKIERFLSQPFFVAEVFTGSPGKYVELKDPKDNRASILSITQKGIEIIEQVFPTHASNLTKTLEVLSDEELNTLYDLLNKVYRAN